MNDRDDVDGLLNEVQRLGADLDIADAGSVQQYAEALSRLLLARPDKEILRVELQRGDWTDSDRALAAAVEARDVETVKSELLKQGIPAAAVEQMIESLQTPERDDLPPVDDA
jgi:hypothetical protein